MSELNLGSIITGEQHRDAIHIAVAPVVTAESLQPGQHVGLDANGQADSEAKHIGVIDPFLKSTARRGSTVWLFLYPNTITSLRHEWAHPAFGLQQSPGVIDKTASERWLRNFIDGADCPSYETVIAAAANHDGGDSWSDEYLHFEGSDAHGVIPPEFWTHVEIVTGKKIEKRAAYFSCSC
jgi:hypothetical protein